MAQVFKSGAFLQQCWSVHPLCIEVRRMTKEDQLGLACTSCRFAHYLTVASVVARTPAVEGADHSKESVSASEGLGQLVDCLGAHAPALSLREMDVFEETVMIRCAECRRQYTLAISSFETHQK